MYLQPQMNNLIVMSWYITIEELKQRKLFIPRFLNYFSTLGLWKVRDKGNWREQDVRLLLQSIYQLVCWVWYMWKWKRIGSSVPLWTVHQLRYFGWDGSKWLTKAFASSIVLISLTRRVAAILFLVKCSLPAHTELCFRTNHHYQKIHHYQKMPSYTVSDINITPLSFPLGR